MKSSVIDLEQAAIEKAFLKGRLCTRSLLVEEDTRQMSYEEIKMDYSMKNIPLSSKSEYKMQLLHKTREFLRRMRIKAYFYEKHLNEETNNEPQKEKFGFKSEFNPAQAYTLLSSNRR